MDAHVQHADQIVMIDRGEQIPPGAVLEELGRCERKWAKQHHGLAVELAGIQVRYRHGRGAGRGDAISFHVMAGCQLGVLDGQELTTHWETGVVLGFGDAGGLQQLERGTAGTHEHKLGLDSLFLAAVGQIGHGHVPGLIGILAQGRDFALQVQAEIRALLQRSHELLGPDAVVHIGAQGHVGGGDFLAWIAAFNHQWGPLLDLCLVLGILHAVEQGVLDQGLLTLL